MAHYLLLFIGLWLFLQMYFKIATHYQIIDKPNNRSSHTNPTVRGGGVVIVAAIAGWFAIYNFQFPWFVMGALLIAAISFADDVKAQNAAVRSIVHLLAFAFLLYQVPLLSPWWMVIIISIVGIGAVNAFNFMDGINGITGVYAVVNLITLLYINYRLIEFTTTGLIVFVTVSVAVFMMYNFRRIARCFAGDVGSVTLAYFQIFLVLQLISTTGDFRWVLFFLVYGIDAVATITYRLIKKENIFKAHRSHLYQYLANECGYSHLRISVIYGALQLLINVILIMTSHVFPGFLVSLVMIITMTVFYVVAREEVLKRLGKEGIVYKILKK